MVSEYRANEHNHDWQTYENPRLNLYVRYCKPCDIIERRQGRKWVRSTVPFSRAAIQLE